MTSTSIIDVHLSDATTLLSKAKAADAAKDWCAAYALYQDLARLGKGAGIPKDTTARRRRAGIKYQEQLRASGNKPAADYVLKSLVQEVVELLPLKGIASSLTIPAGFDSFGAMLISHNVGNGWLPTYATATKDIARFTRILESGDLAVTPAQAAELIRAVAPMLHKAPFGFWMIAHSILFRSGFIEASYVAKEEAAKRVLAEPKMQPAARNSATAFISGEASSDSGSSSDDFARFIQGKSIALVGPAENALLSGAEIDTFDVIVRTNPIELETLKRMASSIGSRTDVAYYNGRMLDYRQEDAHRAMRESADLRFACFRGPEDTQEAVAVLGEHRVRCYTMSKSIFMGRGYALRHYLADLLRFSPSKIKVFNADFFLSMKTHYDGYLDTKLNLPHSYVIHDVRESWMYMRNCLLNGQMEADAVLEDILRLSEQSFSERITTRLSTVKSTELRVLKRAPIFSSASVLFKPKNSIPPTATALPARPEKSFMIPKLLRKFLPVKKTAVIFKNAAIFNDTSADLHYGCDLVMDRLRAGLREAGLNTIWTRSVREDWREHQDEILNLPRPDVVLVNGEGSIHHTDRRPRAQALVQLAKFVRERLGVPVILVNSTLHAMQDSDGELLAHYNGFYLRSNASNAHLAKMGIANGKVVHDITLSATPPKPESKRHGVLVTDSVKQPLTAMLEEMAKAKGWNYLPLRHHGNKPDELDAKLWESSRPAAFMAYLQQHEYVVTGRFHCATLALLTKTPVIAIESNTPKIKSLFKDILGSTQRILRPEDLAALDISSFSYSPNELERIDRSLKDQRKRTAQMFEDIRSAADLG